MEVHIPVFHIELSGMLEIPDQAKGLVLFAHGSGSSRFSSRNNQVAAKLREEGLGTLLFDLLTEEEDRYRENRFDIELLTQRLLAATEWTMENEASRNLSKGYFGASTGAASALKAATELGDAIQAIVSRGGRPDLASEVLHRVTAPTLLIVGGRDTQVIRLNKEAYQQMQSEKSLEIVEGASHLFEEPGKLDVVAELATRWFLKYLS